MGVKISDQRENFCPAEIFYPLGNHQGHSAVEPRSIDAAVLAAAAYGLGTWELGAAELGNLGS